MLINGIHGTIRLGLQRFYFCAYATCTTKKTVLATSLSSSQESFGDLFSTKIYQNATLSFDLARLTIRYAQNYIPARSDVESLALNIIQGLLALSIPCIDRQWYLLKHRQDISQVTNQDSMCTNSKATGRRKHVRMASEKSPAFESSIVTLVAASLQIAGRNNKPK